MYETFLEEFLDKIGADNHTRTHLYNSVKSTIDPQHKILLKKCEEIHPEKKPIKYVEKVDLACNTELLKIQELTNFEVQIRNAIQNLSYLPDVKKMDLQISNIAKLKNTLQNDQEYTNIGQNSNPKQVLDSIKLNLLEMIADALQKLDQSKKQLKKDTLESQNELALFNHSLKQMNITPVDTRKILINFKSLQIKDTLQNLQKIHQKWIGGATIHKIEKEIEIQHSCSKSGIDDCLNITKSKDFDNIISDLLKKTKMICQYSREVTAPLRNHLQTDMDQLTNMINNPYKERSVYHVQRIDDKETAQIDCGGLLRLFEEVVNQEELLDILGKVGVQKKDYKSEQDNLTQMISKIENLNYKLDQLRLRKSERVHYLD